MSSNLTLELSGRRAAFDEESRVDLLVPMPLPGARLQHRLG